MTDSDRKVFFYYDGVARKAADPLAVYRKLFAALDGDPDPVFARAAAPDPAVRLPAQGQLAGAVRTAFDMAPFDPATGGGATESDCLAAVYEFTAWLDAKKGTPASSPTSSTASALPPSARPAPTPGAAG